MRSLLLMLVALIGYCPLSASAEVLCVRNPTELVTAFSTAAQSTAATEIRIRTGFYTLPQRLNYASPSDLTITGGWEGAANGCISRTPNSEITVLSTNSADTIMRVFLLNGANTEFTITGLAFRSGASNGALAACLDVESDVGSLAVVRIQRNVFRLCNNPTGSGSALNVLARSATVYVTNNMFTDNLSNTGIVSLRGLGSSTLYLLNNTLANNPQPSPGGGPGGLQVGGQPSDLILMTNNVMWNNGTGTGYDLLVNSGTPAIMQSNLVGKFAPIPPGVVNNNTLSVDPGFTNIVDFRPRVGAAIRNSGAVASEVLTMDLDGAARVQSNRIDRGAYEFPEIFSNGFN
jgi:hypothetical protein